MSAIRCLERSCKFHSHLRTGFSANLRRLSSLIVDDVESKAEHQEVQKGTMAVISSEVLKPISKPQLVQKLPKFSGDNHDLLDLINKSIDTPIKPFSEDYDPEFIDTLAPSLGPTFNLASYADQSKTLQRLIQLGVKLYKIEQSRTAAEFILKLDFQKDIKPHLLFLAKHGVRPKAWANFISEHPMVFDETLANLEIRINSLKAKKFNKRAIACILNTYPKFLAKSVVEVDAHLGFFQQLFKLRGIQVKQITTKYPNFIDIHTSRFRHIDFSLKEEMGFNLEQMHAILAKTPQVLAEYRQEMVPRFDLIHNEIGIPHELITSFPQVLLENIGTMRERHLYLKKLQRDQYDPTKPGYVPISALTSATTDTTFANKYAKTSVPDFNTFLKTL